MWKFGQILTGDDDENFGIIIKDEQRLKDLQSQSYHLKSLFLMSRGELLKLSPSRIIRGKKKKHLYLKMPISL